MTEPNLKAKKPVRYMDFIGKKPDANADPLASRPAARSVKKPEKVERVHSVSDQIPPKGAVRPAANSPEVPVKKQETKAFISRKPATSRDLYPEPSLTKPITKPSIVSTPRDDLALKASAAISGSSRLAERKSPSAPDNNAYSLGGKSPFLPNYNVDKRPLSNSVPKKKKDENFEKLSFLGVNEEPTHKKNVYEKKEKPEKKSRKEKREEKATGKTVKIIDDTKKKRGFPVWLIIILTILLGAGVGAGVYFLLPK